jgi:glycolate oxidase FAD binding subunit
MSATLGLHAERAVDPARYALGGLAPRWALKPSSAEEVVEALRAASRERLRVLPWGGGTRLGRAAPTGGYDVALDLGALDRIVEYEPEDFTLTAQCGATLRSLRAALAARGQELPLEAPHDTRATLGGTLAVNGSGPRRLRFGSPADRLLGARFVLGDGTVARSGGKVVKNVAGLAVHRLLCGSRGRLAVILEASLKLAPAPEQRVTLLFGAAAAQLAERQRWGAPPRLEPSYLTVLGAAAARAVGAARVEAPFVVAVGLEDDAEWVAEQEARVTAALGAPALRREGDDAVAITQALADAQEGAGARLTFTSAHKTPVALAPVLERAGAERLVSHAAAGRLHWFLDEDDDPSALVRELRAAGYVLIDGGRVNLEGPVAPAVAILDLRERLRAALDPAAALAALEG